MKKENYDFTLIKGDFKQFYLHYIGSMTRQKDCLECGEILVGRVDKKFCSDHCRNSYHNRLNSDNIRLVRNTNRILRKNRRIIERLQNRGRSKVGKEKLINEGFNFTYMTSHYTNKKGTTYYYCYDRGYFKGEEGMLNLVKRESYLD